MMIFVSYSRQDHDLGALQRIEKSVSSWGRPYIDDLHNTSPDSRLSNVLQALQTADRFILVISPNYLTTAWTCAEYRIAIARCPLLTKFMVAGKLVKVSDFMADLEPQGDAVNVRQRAAALLQRDRFSVSLPHLEPALANEKVSPGRGFTGRGGRRTNPF